MTDDRLAEELRALGQQLADERAHTKPTASAEPTASAGSTGEAPFADAELTNTELTNTELADAVLRRIATEPRPAPSRWRPMWARTRAAVRSRRRRILAAAAAVLVLLTFTTPVRATVAEWLRFAGVVVERDPTPAPAGPTPQRSTAPSADIPSAAPLQAVGTTREAARHVGFAPVRPDALGAPDRIGVSDKHRLVSMTYQRGESSVRLDQFAGEPDPVFLKRVHDRVEYVRMPEGGSAWWFARPHELVLLDHDGRERTASTRTAAATLVWAVDGVTLRLEGLPRAEAAPIARQTVGTN